MSLSSRYKVCTSRISGNAIRRTQLLFPLIAAFVVAPLLLHTAHAAQQARVTVDTGDTAHVFSAGEINRQYREIETTSKATGGGGANLGDYGNHTIGLSQRSSSGGAEIHAHWNDILFVQQGKGILCTGGTVVDSKTVSEGQIQGSSIRGGTRQEIAVGDVIHIPAGTPHQILLRPGTSIRILVVKVKQ